MLSKTIYIYIIKYHQCENGVDGQKVKAKKQ